MRITTMTLAACAALAAAVAGRARADVIEGPYVAYYLTNSPDSGMQFTALQDVTMTNFIFYNQGIADTIQLWDATDNLLIDSLDTTQGYTEHFFRVDWDLHADHTYWLVSLLPSNGRFIEFDRYPVANEHLRVDGAIDGGRTLHTDVWYSFRFLTTVPAPGAAILLGAGLVARPGRRRR